MKLVFKIIFATFFFLNSCSQNQTEEKENAVYFWKTVFALDSTEQKFLNDFEIKKIFLRYFDIILDKNTLQPKPNATIKFKSKIPENIEIVPTVFITENCINHNLDTLYKTIAQRILQINKTHKIQKIKEIQIDCDYTAKSMKKYYTFLSLLQEYLNKNNIKLSTTIRLHQLSMEIPPCNYGVLMLYNTGNYRDKNCENPILGLKETKPYLKNLKKYKLKLKTAFPNFKWQILFKKGKFNNILYNQDLNDTTLFEKISDKVFKVVRSRDIPIYLNTDAFNVMLNYGDTIFEKKADSKEILNVAQEVKKIRKDILQNIIIYDLNSVNINNLKHEEYEKIFNYSNLDITF